MHAAARQIHLRLVQWERNLFCSSARRRPFSRCRPFEGVDVHDLVEEAVLRPLSLGVVMAVSAFFISVSNLSPSSG